MHTLKQTVTKTLTDAATYHTDVKKELADLTPVTAPQRLSTFDPSNPNLLQAGFDLSTLTDAIANNSHHQKTLIEDARKADETSNGEACIIHLKAHDRLE